MQEKHFKNKDKSRIQAYLRDTAGSVPDHRNEVKMTVK